MKNSKKITEEFEQNQSPCDRLFELFPIEAVRELLSFPLGSIAMRTALQKYMEDHNLVISKCYSHHEVLMMQLCAQNGIFEKTGKSSNQLNYTNVPKFLPDKDMWDAALLDFYMYVIDWSSTRWIAAVSEMQDERDCNKLTILSNNYQNEEASLDKRELAVCFGLATSYLLLKSLQLWQKDYLDFKSATTGSSFNKGVSGIVGSVGFIKNLLRSASSEVPGGNEINQQVHKETLTWNQLATQYTGLLSILKDEVAAILVDYFTANVLHKHLLLERLFGLVTARRQKQLDVCCVLDLWTLPKVFEGTSYQWPPPLSEAIPLNLVATYNENFDEQVKRWLPCLIRDEDLLPSRCVSEDTQQEEVEETASEAEEDRLEKPDEKEEGHGTDLYLLLLKPLKLEELVLLSRLSAADVTETVQEVVQRQAGRDETGGEAKLPPPEDLLNSQSRLADQLVEAARMQATGSSKGKWEGSSV